MLNYCSKSRAKFWKLVDSGATIAAAILSEC